MTFSGSTQIFIKCLLPLCFISIISGCENADLSETQVKRIRQEVITTLESYCIDVRDRGLMAEFDYLDSSEAFSWLPPGFESSLGFDSVASIIRSNASAVKSMENTYEDVSVLPLSRHCAWYSARVSSITTDTGGVTTKNRLVETGIMVKRGDGWKLLSGHTSILD